MSASDDTVRASVNGGAPTSAQVAVSELVARQEKRRAELGNLGVPMARAATYLDRWVQSNFRTAGGNVGGWVPFRYGGRLMPDGSINPAAKLLMDTGRLRASFLPWSTAHNAGIGSELDYSATHEYGLGAPIRRMLPERGEVLTDLHGILRDHVVRAISLDEGVRA